VKVVGSYHDGRQACWVRVKARVYMFTMHLALHK